MPSALRMLRAFAWLRWRMLVNALEHTGSRDRLERFSIAIDKLGPIMAGILLIPSGVMLAGVGAYAGFELGQGTAGSLIVRIARFALFAVPMLAIIGPLFLPAADRTNPIRLLLLPIPRSTLYIAQSAAAFGDPWTILLVPLLLGIVGGVAASGALFAAATALLGAALLVLIVVGISSLATSILHLVVRDRRRGELAALIFIVILPLVGMIPSLMQGSSRRDRGAPRKPLALAWVTQAGTRALAVYPTELFVNGTRAAGAAAPAGTAVALAGLAVTATALHGLGLLAFRRVMESPGTSGPRRAGSNRAAWSWALPGISRAASAVAAAQLRLALRTPRGRSIFLMPLAMLVLFGVMTYRGSGTMDFGPFRFAGGISLATFVSTLSLLSILPIAMNQFAVDKAGLTMALLSPLTVPDLLTGKAVGNALIAVPPILLTLVVLPLVFPPGPLALWVALLLGLLSIYLVFAPIAAICSAVFPREVDMNSIGRGSNAHGASGFIGLLTFAGAGLPPLLLSLLAVKMLDRIWLAPVLVAVWVLVSWALSRALFAVARRTFVARRENFAML